MMPARVQLFRLVNVICSALLLAIAARSAAAQQFEYPGAPQIIVGGHAELTIPPTSASFTIGVQTSASTAAAAGAHNATLSKAVNEALAAARIGREEIAGATLAVGPRWVYDEATRRQNRAAFVASNTIRIETEHLDRVALYIDAALSAGATEVSDIFFTAKNQDSARRQALGKAVDAARADAEAMAIAGGGTLGALVSLSTDDANASAPVRFASLSMSADRRAAEPASTDVIAHQIRVSVQVTGHWCFLPNSTRR